MINIFNYIRMVIENVYIEKVSFSKKSIRGNDWNQRSNPDSC